MNIQSKDDYDAGQGEYEETQDLINEMAKEDYQNMNYKTKSQWAAEGRTVESAAVIGAPLNEDGEPVFPESSTYGEPEHTVTQEFDWLLYY